jgi:hypothetical protein
LSPSTWRLVFVVAPAAAACGSFGSPASTPDGGSGPTTDAAAADCTLVRRHADTLFKIDDYTTKVTVDGGVLEHANDDRSGGAAGGGSLHAALPADSSPEREAQISKSIDLSPAKVRLKFSSKLRASGVASAGCVLILRTVESQAERFEIRSLVAANQLRFDVLPYTGHEPGARIQVDGVGAADLATWYDVTYELSAITATSAHVRILVAGEPKLDVDAQLPVAPSSIRFKCGIDNADDGVLTEAYVDDLELEACSP